jgi:hypothetical protein
VDAGRGKADDGVAFRIREPSIRRSRSTIDARRGEIELLVAIDVRELRRLPPMSATLPAGTGSSFDQLGDLLQVDPTGGDVVEQEEGSAP